MAGVYNRSYMRGGGYNSFGVIGGGLKWLLIINIGMFFLQNVLFLGFGHFNIGGYLGLSYGLLVGGGVWTLITYSFIHANFLHLLFNMLMLFFMGTALEGYLGTKRFLQLYFLAVFLSALGWLVLKMGSGDLLVGASGGAMGLLAFFCLLRPEQPITLLLFFVLPVTVKPKWVFWGTLVFEGYMFFFQERLGLTTIASSAHLGGFFGGVVYYYFIYREMRVPVVKSFGFSWKKREEEEKRDIAVNKEELQREVDRILDKINAVGFGALTDVEKKILDKAKDILNKK